MSAACGEVPARDAVVGVRARVMVVEDDLEMALAVRHILERERYQVELCTNGSEALATLRSQALPDLIVLDLWTPTMDGWEFRLHQKQDPRLADIPLIAVSADRSAHAAAIDADRFLAKPLTAPTLLASVAELLGTKLRRPPPARSPVDRWNALFMTLTDLADARAHAKLLVSELRGFPAARTVALDVLLDRAELCARRALQDHQQELPPSGAAPGEAAPLRFDSLDAFLAQIDPHLRISDLPALPDAFWDAPSRASRVHSDLLGLLACCLREPESGASRLRFELEADGAPRVRGEPMLLAQLLRNVLRNAVEAMEEAPVPTLRVQLATHATAVELRIADSGRGAPLRELERAFDPFFSTKPGHAGLGLTVARRIATRLEGRIELDREPGGGSAVRLTLPLADVREHAADEPLARPRLLLVHHPERSRTLEAGLRACFDVAVMNPDEAVRHLLGGNEYELVLCALVLPQMTGISFVSALAMAVPVLAGRLVIAIPPKFGPETSKLLDQLYLWHVDEEQPASALNESLLNLLALWRALRFR